MFSLSFWSIMAKMAVRSSPASSEVSIPCSSKPYPYPQGLQLPDGLQALLGVPGKSGGGFHQDLIHPAPPAARQERWKSSRFSAEVPVMPLSAYTSTNSHSGLSVMSSV